MYKVLPQSEGANIAYEISGKVSVEQEAEMIQRTNALITEYGRINLLAVLKNGASWTVQSSLMDIKWGVESMQYLNRIAIVADSDWWKVLTKADAFFARWLHIEERHFVETEFDTAWQWVTR